jgi:hypothetical protein
MIHDTIQIIFELLIKLLKNSIQFANGRLNDLNIFIFISYHIIFIDNYLGFLHIVKIYSLRIRAYEFELSGVMQVFYFPVVFALEVQVQRREIVVLFPTLAHVENILFFVAQIVVFFPMKLAQGYRSFNFTHGYFNLLYLISNIFLI